jgi:hypothetical protein
MQPACSQMLLLALCASFFSTAVDAANPLGFYVGAGVGASHIRSEGSFDDADYEYDEHDTRWKAIAGIRPISP